jgi:hypothetical protein
MVFKKGIYQGFGFKKGQKGYWYGKKFSKEAKKNMSLAKKKMWANSEIKNKISKSLKGKEPWNKNKKGLQQAWNKGIKQWENKIPPTLGRHHTDEEKEKLRQAQLKNTARYWKGKKMPEEAKLKMKEHHWSKNKEFKHPMLGKHHNINSKKKMSIKKLRYLKEHPEKLEELKEMGRQVIVPLRDTSIEIKIQNFLKELKIGFFTHQYIKDIENRYCCDIFIPVQRNRDRFISQPIIIECDGNYWHSYPIDRDIDNIRTKELTEKGYKVIRLWESKIKQIDLNNFKELVQ